MATVLTQEKNLKQHESWPDLCRVIAIFGVILIHACGPTFYQYGKIPMRDWLSANLLDSMVRCCVPLFVMLSGALLLKKTSPVTVSQVVYRIKKVLFPLLTWSACYLYYLASFTGLPINWLSIFSEPAMYHLWFVYMIIGIYIFLPVLQAIFQMTLHRREMQVYLLIVWLCFTSLPSYWKSIPLLMLLQQNGFFGYGGYFLLGGIITSEKTIPIPTWVLVLIYSIGAAVTFFLTFYFSYHANLPVEKAYKYFSLNVFICSITSFVVLTRMKISKVYNGLLKWVSDRSFLIFLMHVVILERVGLWGPVLRVSRHVPLLITLGMVTTITFIVCLMIAGVIRLFPGSKLIFG